MHPSLSASVLLSLLLLALPAAAQDTPKPAPLPAPRWQVGDTWLIATYVREPPPEAGPAAASLTRPLRGLNPLRGGVPQGWIELDRWRFRVERRASLRHPEDPRSAAPLACWVLSARPSTGERELELWFSAAELRLLRLVERAPRAPLRETWFGGSVSWAPRLAARLGLPLAWPDLSEGPATRQVSLAEGETLRQASEPARPNAPATVTLSRGDTLLVRLRLGQAHPWWLESRGPQLRARLLRWSRAR